MVRYPSIIDCQETLFPFIRRHMAGVEPAPDYEFERRGVNGIQGIFGLMERDDYGNVLAKAAYLFCSVIDGHHFSNGNKRLAVALLTFFLIVNGYKISAPDLAAIEQGLRDVFPNLHWENVQAFKYPHEYFFYHLALVIADRKQKGKMTFTQEQLAVVHLLEKIVIEPG